MPQSFVRYSPDVERADPDFEQALQTVLDMMKRHMNGSLKAEGIGRVVRDAHAKGYGLAQAEVEILGGLPEVYAQGIYANPGRHEAMVRFSNGTSHTAADRFLGATAGIGLKMFGIEGKTLLEDEPDSHTFDLSRRFQSSPTASCGGVSMPTLRSRSFAPRSWRSCANDP